MANFQVPQFIEVEDKIFGPLTFKQFVYLAGGGGVAFMEWVYIPVKFIAIIFVAPTVTFALLLAFYKVNKRPFINVVESAFYYMFSKKLYIWKRSAVAPTQSNQVLPSQSAGALNIPKYSESKLKDLSWSLDVREKIK